MDAVNDGGPDGGAIEITVAIGNDGDRDGIWIGSVSRIRAPDHLLWVFSLEVPAHDSASRTVRPITGLDPGETVNVRFQGVEAEFTVPSPTTDSA